MSTVLSIPVVSNPVHRRPVLGSYGKAVAGACSLNYGTSGGKHCDPRCSHYNVDCYAARTEIRPDRTELANKLARHESTDPAELTNQALAELQRMADKGQEPPWFRFSTNGSLPTEPDPDFADAIRRLVDFLQKHEVPAHLPVETADKARKYRRILNGKLVVRESCHTKKRFLTAKGAVSMTAGTREQSRLERVAASKALAAERTVRTGRKCIVCPAVASRYLHHNKPSEHAKCGNCTACALAHMDVVYPLH